MNPIEDLKRINISVKNNFLYGPKHCDIDCNDPKCRSQITIKPEFGIIQNNILIKNGDEIYNNLQNYGFLNKCPTVSFTCASRFFYKY